MARESHRELIHRLSAALLPFLFPVVGCHAGPQQSERGRAYGQTLGTRRSVIGAMTLRWRMEQLEHRRPKLGSEEEDRQPVPQGSSSLHLRRGVLRRAGMGGRRAANSRHGAGEIRTERALIFATAATEFASQAASCAHPERASPLG